MTVLESLMPTTLLDVHRLARFQTPLGLAQPQRGMDGCSYRTNKLIVLISASGGSTVLFREWCAAPHCWQLSCVRNLETSLVAGAFVTTESGVATKALGCGAASLRDHS